MILTKFNQRKQAGKLAFVCVVGVFVLDLVCSQASAFPSLFNVRAQSIFKRQQQQQPIKPQQDQLMPMSNAQAGLSKGDQQQLQFNGASQLVPGELMRLSSMQRPEQIGAHQLHHAFLSAAGSNPHQQRHFIYADNEHEASRGPNPFYRPNVAQPMTASAIMQRQHQQPIVVQDQGATFDLGDHTNYFADVQANSLRPTGKQLAQAGSGVSNQLHLEPTHTSEIVDKIEQHIGQQVERTLNHDQHHQANQQQQTAASGYAQHAGEKETAQSEEQEETSAGSGGGSGSESSSADEAGGEEKLEKRHEEHHKEPAESHKHHHEEHPPEAFEVHHKKGGKSFQYFHQGHQHHA